MSEKRDLVDEPEEQPETPLGWDDALPLLERIAASLEQRREEAP